MLRALCQRAQRFDQRLPATLRDIDVFFDKALIVRLIRKEATHKGEAMTGGKSLPDWIVHLWPTIAVRTRQKDRDCAHLHEIFRNPQSEFGFVEIAAGRDDFVKRRSHLRLDGGRNKKRTDDQSENQTELLHLRSISFSTLRVRGLRLSEENRQRDLKSSRIEDSLPPQPFYSRGGRTRRGLQTPRRQNLPRESAPAGLPNDVYR